MPLTPPTPDELAALHAHAATQAEWLDTIARNFTARGFDFIHPTHKLVRRAQTAMRDLAERLKYDARDGVRGNAARVR